MKREARRHSKRRPLPRLGNPNPRSTPDSFRHRSKRVTDLNPSKLCTRARRRPRNRPRTHRSYHMDRRQEPGCLPRPWTCQEEAGAYRQSFPLHPGCPLCPDREDWAAPAQRSQWAEPPLRCREASGRRPAEDPAVCPTLRSCLVRAASPCQAVPPGPERGQRFPRQTPPLQRTQAEDCAAASGGTLQPRTASITRRTDSRPYTSPLARLRMHQAPPNTATGRPSISRPDGSQLDAGARPLENSATPEHRHRYVDCY
jgi:hypothetical protein